MASLKRIAADLDISYTLVSKVLSGRLGTTGVSVKTKEAILKKAKELNYVPNRLAVALKAGRKGAVGVFLHQAGSPGSSVSERLLRGLSEGLDAASIRMWLRFFQTDGEFVAACDSRLKSEVDGLIVAGVGHPGLKSKLAQLERSGVPVAAIFNNTPEVSHVTVNYQSHGYLAAAHLLAQGCRKIACFRTVESRTAGFLQAHREAGVKVDPRLMVDCKSFMLEDGRKGLEELLKRKSDFDSIVCQSDTQAIGAINSLIQRGVRVPEDVKVTGVDNSPAANDCIVPITSVTSEMRPAGRKAVEILLQKIGGGSPKRVVIEPRLVARASSGFLTEKSEDPEDPLDI